MKKVDCSKNLNDKTNANGQNNSSIDLKGNSNKTTQFGENYNKNSLNSQIIQIQSSSLRLTNGCKH